MLEAILLITVLAAWGACATYFAPSKLRAGAVFILSYAFMVIGISLYYLSTLCIRVDTMVTWIESMHGNAEIGPISAKGQEMIVIIRLTGHNPYAWVERWIDPYLLLFVGALLAIFGLGACLGCGLRKVTTGFGPKTPPSDASIAKGDSFC